MVRVLFHPTKPFFFVATQQHVRAGAADLGALHGCTQAQGCPAPRAQEARDGTT